MKLLTVLKESSTGLRCGAYGSVNFRVIDLASADSRMLGNPFFQRLFVALCIETLSSNRVRSGRKVLRNNVKTRVAHVKLT